MTTGTNVPKSLVPGVKKGFLDYCEKGRLAGFPITGVRMVLADGAHHEVDSSEWAFYQASQFAIDDVYHVSDDDEMTETFLSRLSSRNNSVPAHSMQDGQWVILEPIMYVEVVAPEESQGSVMTMMSRRDGLILGSDGADGWVTLEAEAPLNKVGPRLAVKLAIPNHARP